MENTRLPKQLLNYHPKWRQRPGRPLKRLPDDMAAETETGHPGLNSWWNMMTTIYNNKYHGLYGSQSIVRTVKSMRVWWIRYLVMMGEKRKSIHNFSGITLRRRMSWVGCIRAKCNFSRIMSNGRFGISKIQASDYATRVSEKLVSY
jgi:hypothetical protein